MQIDQMLKDENVTEIIFTYDDKLIFEKFGKLEHVDSIWDNPSQKEEFERSVVNSLVKAPSYENPMATGVWQNFRVQILSPPVVPKGINIQLRRFASNQAFKDFDANNWSAQESDEELEAVLKNKFKEHSNFLIVGATGCGKTTLLKSLLFSYCRKDRIVCLEDTPELPKVNELSSNLRTYASSSAEIPNVTLNDLVETSLRLRPDRLIMGEMRGPEAASFLLMLSTGHKGSGATLHAKNPLDALYRLEMLTQLGSSWSVQTVRKLIHSALDVIIVVDRDQNGKRVVREIGELAGLESEGFLIHSLYTSAEKNPLLF